MKRILPILMIALALQGSAQNYIPLIDNSSVWLVRHGNGEADPTFFYYGFTGEDTLINNVSYRKLFASEDTIFSANEYYAALREDINTRQVFGWGIYETAERILYDFSLNTGDSLNYIDGISGFYYGNTVYAVVSEFIAGMYRKNIYLQVNLDSMGIQWLSGSWVEGIGSIGTGGLMLPTTAQPLCDCGEKLVCFKNNGTWKYHNPEFSNIDCSAPMGTTGVSQETLANSRNLIVYPNPVNEMSTLGFTDNTNIERAEVYDIMGRLVASHKPVNGKIEIRKRDYIPACYYYRAYDNLGNQVTGKFIVE